MRSPVSGILSSTSGKLIGTLANGDLIDVSFDAFGNGSLNLVPEPSVASLALVSLLALGRHRR